jgi:DNA-binding MarR family transcriptional regulator
VNGPATVSAITAGVDVSQQAVSKTLRELVALGYVEQTADPHDRRRRPIHLSARGREAVEVSRRARREFETRLQERVDAADLAATRRVLRAGADTLGLTGSITRRAVAPPPEHS